MKKIYVLGIMFFINVEYSMAQMLFNKEEEMIEVNEKYTFPIKEIFKAGKTGKPETLFEYDFSSKKPPKPNHIKYNSYARYQISNINPFIYKIQLDNELINFNFPMPNELESSLFKAQETETKANKAKSKAAGVVPGLTITYKSKFDAYIDAVKNLNKLNNTIKKILITVETENSTLTQIKSQIAKIMNDHIGGGALSETKLKHEFNDGVNNSLIQVNDAYEDLIHNSSPIGAVEVALKDQAIELNKKVQEINYPEIAERIIKIYDQSLTSEFNVLSSPVRANADRIKFTVKIEPATGLKYAQPSRKEEFEVIIDTYGRFKLDFSTGIFATNLISHSFTTKTDSLPDKSGTGQRIIREDEGKWKISLGAMLHAYYKAYPGFGVGGNLGIITNTNSLMQYLVGGSLMFGNSQRIILNGGLALGSVERLSSGLNESDFVESASAIGTKNKLRNGFYFGVTYNLTRSTE